MQCDLCGHVEATVHLTEIVGDQTRELHLCEPCAREKGVKVEPSFGLADLLSGLADLDPSLGATAEQTPLTCPQCGMRFEDVKRSGRLGCGACYEAFRRPIAVLLRRIHGAARHTGKVPAAMSTRARFLADLEGLKARLKQAVKVEAFEDAARLRDQIATAEQQAKRQGGGHAQRPRRTR